MINNDRIVPVQKIDLLSLYGTVLGLIGTSYAVLFPADVIGEFEVAASGAAGNLLCSQPVKTLDFKSGTTSGTVYFIAGYDFSAITVAGAAATIDDSGLALDEINPDGVTLYKAVLGSGEVTLSSVTPDGSAD